MHSIVNPALGIDCIAVLLAFTSNGNTHIKLTFLSVYSMDCHVVTFLQDANNEGNSQFQNLDKRFQLSQQC